MFTFLTLLACLPEFPNRTTEYLENPDADYDQDGYTENQGDCNDDDPTTSITKSRFEQHPQSRRLTL